MGYLLKVCMGENRLREVENPSPEIIDQAIDNLIPVKFHFVILVAEPRIEDCDCVQTLIDMDDELEIRYTLEAHFKCGEQFTYMQKYTTDVDELKKTFRMFALGVVPKTDNWSDITVEVLAEIERDMKNRKS